MTMENRLVIVSNILEAIDEIEKRMSRLEVGSVNYEHYDEILVRFMYAHSDACKAFGYRDRMVHLRRITKPAVKAV